MARNNQTSNPKGESDEDDLYMSPPPPSTPPHASSGRQSDLTSLSASPAASISSDKENRSSAGAIGRDRNNAKGKDKAVANMPPPRTSVSGEAVGPREAKRRRLINQQSRPSNANQSSRTQEPGSFPDTQYYDPDQPVEERRAVRKGLRDLSRNLNDSRAELLAPDSTGLIDTVYRANALTQNVKQTSDATLDSRVLVTTADLSYRKTAQLTLGDASRSIDVDEFVTKCIRFMRTGTAAPPSSSTSGGVPGSTQRQRRRHTGQTNSSLHDNEDDDDDNDDGDALDWEAFGRKVCFPHNNRPPVPGFLLGPLSLQRRVRAPRARRENLQRRNGAEATRPQELLAADLDKTENSSLTALCTDIRAVLARTQTDGRAACEAATADTDLADDEVRALMARHHIADDEGVPLFPFVVHPSSFGQTVENLFYVSFLIRDGSIGVGEDSDGLPTLHATKPRKPLEAQAQGIRKHQAVFALDFSMWQALVESFHIDRPLIPERHRDEAASVDARGWYT
ncbi:MAG: hypothetical protein M1825_001378 [Sarcosagium campestre]|nr:MAG: hypothetical protein M1825_001378 [Sarcosagium campestre]